MEKQKICIIGDGLSGLTSAIALNNLKNVEIHLISRKSKNITDKRTTAISESNLNFLKANISNLNTKLFWPSKHIELFYETNSEKINFLNFDDEKNNLMHVCENKKLKDILIKEIKKRKIKIIKKEIKDIDSIKNYELKILCLGSKSKLYDRIIKIRSIEKDYKEIAITGHVIHKLKKIKTSQSFLKEGPLAILPFSKNKFSFVWSLDNNFFNENNENIHTILKDKIKKILDTKKNFKINHLQSYPIKLGLKRKYHHKNTLVLGEGLHVIHPVAGQGFNLVIRDIKKLKEIIDYYTKLGISLNNSNALKDFNLKRKPENIIVGLGVDVTHNFFKKNLFLDPLKSILLKNLNNNNTVKKISKIISNSGLSF
ncbi:MAG: FAD-dependent monooxygenase [Pelagibacteraceae bacterium]